MTDDWYTSDIATLGKAKKGTVFRRSDTKYTSSDILASDVYVEGRLFEPNEVVTPTGQSGSYLPFYRPTGYSAGRWQEILLMQTGRELYPAYGQSSDQNNVPVGFNTHTLALRIAQTPLNMGRHWERRSIAGTPPAEYESIDMLGMSLNTYHAECSEAFSVAVQTLDWNVNQTLNTGATTDDITMVDLTIEPFKWEHFTFPTFTYNSETIEADIVGWAHDVRNTVRITGLDSGKRFEKAKYIPLTLITTTLEIIPFGRNAFEIIRTPLNTYLTDLDLTVNMVKTANEDQIIITQDKCYCRPYTLSALKRPGSVERYFMILSQLNTGSSVPVIIDGNDDDHYTNP